MKKTKLPAEKLHKIPLRITDTTLRDAHQSLWATRMRTDDMMRIIDTIDNVGYYSLECWGGATFDVCLRFLREDPWERLRQIKSKAKNTPLQMLLRGQNLVGYRNYSDDVVDRFVALACKNGIDIFRIFDALNDTRNLEAAIKAVKKHGGHAQGTLCYTISKIHTVEKYITYAKEQAALGIDSLCIKDMAGILSPIGAEKLVSGLIEELGIPVQLHCHTSSGMAMATYVEGVRGGAGAIDCAIATMAGFSSQPPVETMNAIFSETNYSADLDMDALEKVEEYFETLAPKRRQNLGANKFIDPGILMHQIPGGMISNFRSQLEMQRALDKLPQVLDEVSSVREDLGFPPLVTPTSQIVGTQAVMNIIAGERYKIVPNEVKDYLRGKYGRSPAPIKKDFLKRILGDEKPINHRPADNMEPMLPKATDGIDAKLIHQEEDILSYVLLPEPAMQYFQWRELPDGVRPETPADIEVKKQNAEYEKASDMKAAVTDSMKIPPKESMKAQNVIPAYAAPDIVTEIMQKIDGLTFEEVVLRKGIATISVRPNGGVTVAAPSISSPPSVVSSGAEATSAIAASSIDEVSSINEAPAIDTEITDHSVTGRIHEIAVDESGYDATIDAPFVGMLYLSPGSGKPTFVKVGDIVEKGDKVCIIEAMKLFNEITAPERCKIVSIIHPEGSSVTKGLPLFGIKHV